MTLTAACCLSCDVRSFFRVSVVHMAEQEDEGDAHFWPFLYGKDGQERHRPR